ncbi:hypothetical protein GCG54_00007061 [Colletotrichum gloeosporioides]|uniref:CFEM domain-containing protein n=1 Tax=Colletotrichum gloeosporioides TaxID=474922 RepID=A0A8H4CN61_COLGL|nr:uncharacterized protein GCG54_00007061 [Colletotrichum gloeosporioides]KAF3806812.1 hypothetical protein GCG54_00007061 [Colletotrichum gloeosporioides]
MKAFLFTAALAIRFASAVNGTTWRTEMPYCAQYCFVTGGDSLTNCQLGLDDECICTESTDDVLREVMKTCVEIKCNRFNRKFAGDIWPIFAEFCVTEGYLDSSETALPSSMTATADPSTVTSAIMTNTPSTTTSAIDMTESTAPTAESDSSSANDDDASSSSRLSPAAKAGIAIGATLPIIVGAVLLALWRKRRKGILSDKDGETAMPELASGDNANRHELGPEAKLFGAGSKAAAELESGHVMAELDGTSCLVYGPETNGTGDETRTTAELDGKSPGPESSTRSQGSPADPGANAARAPARKHCESNSSTSLSPNAGEVEQLPCEGRGLGEGERAEEELQHKPEDEVALRSLIRTLKQRQSSQSSGVGER